MEELAFVIAACDELWVVFESIAVVVPCMAVGNAFVLVAEAVVFVSVRADGLSTSEFRPHHCRMQYHCRASPSEFAKSPIASGLFVP